MPEIAITLTLEELMVLPGEAIIRILDKAKPPKEFLQACLDHEWRVNHGKGRWAVTNQLRFFISASSPA